MFIIFLFVACVVPPGQTQISSDSPQFLAGTREALLSGPGFPVGPVVVYYEPNGGEVDSTNAYILLS